jgi:alpha-tubulin suppressor-like RCC1 family protein
MRMRTLVVTAFLVVASCSDGLGPIPADVFAAANGGFQHTCGLLGDGTAFCWGLNGTFQLGSGGVNERDTVPRAVAGDLGFTHIDAGEGNTCGIATGGAAYCWGSGYNDGALGTDTVNATPVPRPVDGALAFKAITVGQSHGCALTVAGAAYCWGNNDFGKLGADTPAVSISHPVAVAGGRTYTAIAAGWYHTCAIATGGALYCWGNNGWGQLGIADSADSQVHRAPEPVAGGHVFKAIDATNAHTCALTTSGAAYCWGLGSSGQVGNGERSVEPLPALVDGNRTYAALSIGVNHSCAIAGGGQLFCWGGNGGAQLGGTTTDVCVLGPTPAEQPPCSDVPIPSAAGHLFRSVAAGGFHTCAVKSSGGAWCWGGNTAGQIGNGAAGASVVTPVRVADPEP